MKIDSEPIVVNTSNDSGYSTSKVIHVVKDLDSRYDDLVD